MTLDEIAIRHQTDKASQFSRTYAKPHDYCRHLERFFEPIRHNPIKLVEIGIGSGESVRTWLEYFTVPRVFGVDIVANTNEWNTPGAKTHERYTFSHGDQSDTVFWKKFIEVHGGDWGIVIDDGSHAASDIKKTFTRLWPYISAGGIYVAEDLNYDVNSRVWTESLVRHIHDGTIDIDSIYFSKELAILRKK